MMNNSSSNQHEDCPHKKPEKESLVLAKPRRALTVPEFQGLAEVPPKVKWFANIHNRHTRDAYRNALDNFMRFAGIQRPEEFCLETRAHLIARRKTLEVRELAAASIRQRLSGLSALFDYLCECNAVTHNPVKGVKRPFADANEGKTPALGDSQARALLDAPDSTTLKGKRDRAVLSTFLFHRLRCEELCKLKVKDIQERPYPRPRQREKVALRAGASRDTLADQRLPGGLRPAGRP